MAEKVKQKDKSVDWIVLSKDKMITCNYAEHKLVAKKSAITTSQEQHHQKKCQQQEEQVVVPPSAPVSDGNDAVDDHDKALLASTMMPPPPRMCTFLDELNDDCWSKWSFSSLMAAQSSNIRKQISNQGLTNQHTSKIPLPLHAHIQKPLSQVSTDCGLTF